ncbi:MAG TPA: hypothetical protein VKY89_12120 [Thermoanaerobaculia bacterium]|nr:hypothetical protein [Thermoanaerobaculia bacterium]
MPAKDRTAAAPERGWAMLLIRNTLLWLVPVAVLWWFATPVYNRILVDTAVHVLHLFEHPAVTELPAKGDHDAYVVRRDFPPARSLVHPFRVTDVHFHLLLLCALFLAVPRLPWRERLENLAIAVAITVVYDIVLVVFIVEFAYATQLGAWSFAHYGAFARNFFGLGKHLLDLPFKLALPLLLWCAFYLPRLRGGALAPRKP